MDSMTWQELEKFISELSDEQKQKPVTVMGYKTGYRLPEYINDGVDFIRPDTDDNRNCHILLRKRIDHGENTY